MLTNDNDDSRRVVETCYRRHRTLVNPIIEWTDQDVWKFIKAHGIKYCSLYEEGFHRLGCIGCPMAGKNDREREFYRWKKYKHHYLLAFNRMLKERKLKERKTEWQTPQDVFNWWMEYDILPGQYDLFEDADEETGDE